MLPAIRPIEKSVQRRFNMEAFLLVSWVALIFVAYKCVVIVLEKSGKL